jgi:Pentapeptide repeats (9 copies)
VACTAEPSAARAAIFGVRCHPGVVRPLVSAVVMALVVLALVPSAGALTVTASGPGIVKALRSGESVSLFGKPVAGAVDLRNLGGSHATFTCFRCAFRDGVRADGATLRGSLNLAGSQFGGDVDFDRATLLGDVAFDAADFRKRATFAGAVFRSASGFSRTRFGASADFADARFEQRADFSGTEAEGGITFADAKFGNGGGTFFAGRFLPVTSVTGAEPPFVAMTRITSDGAIDFSQAFIDADVSFESAVIGGALSFADTSFSDSSRLSLAGAEVSELSLDVSAVRHVPSDERRRTLKMIETTAAAQDDAAAANNASYELHVLKSQSYDLPVRLADAVFYRGAAGYLIRPLRPLAVLLALAVIASLIRSHRRRKRAPEVRLSSTSGTQQVTVIAYTAVYSTGGRKPSAFPHFLDELWDTLASIGPARGGRAPQTRRPLSQRLEVITYRVLFACFIVALARTNPGLRDMFHAIA